MELLSFGLLILQKLSIVPDFVLRYSKHSILFMSLFTQPEEQRNSLFTSFLQPQSISNT
jgi:hypothetical protein